MRKLPFRTNTTWLSDDDLVLLDAMFDAGASFRLLRRDDFREQWNLGYSHRFNDDELRCRLRWLCEHGVLESSLYNDRTAFSMTAAGGELWSQERCPVWERFCLDYYKTPSRGCTLMTVLAVSPQSRDDYVRSSPMHPERCRTATISDFGLIPWHPFEQLYVSMAIYSEDPWLSEKYPLRIEPGRERSWWRCVPELQRFTRGAA